MGLCCDGLFVWLLVSSVATGVCNLLVLYDVLLFVLRLRVVLLLLVIYCFVA